MAGYTAVPDEFLPCLISGRHSIDWRTQQRQRVRWRYDDGTLDLIEYTGTCGECGTVRVMLRTEDSNEFVDADYSYPPGYRAPKGEPWDRDALREVWNRRHPVTGRRVVVSK